MRLTTIATAPVRGLVVLGIALTMNARLSTTLLAQQSTSPTHPSPTTSAADTATSEGPAFLTTRPSDGERVDARGAPALQRRISLTFIGIPLGMAVQAIADRAGLETTTASGETIPLGARVSMHADDVTVAAALRWVLASARIDVLLRDDSHLVLIPQTSLTASLDSSGVIAGELLDDATGEPVPYGTVTLLGTNIGRFTDRAGQFRMGRLTARRYILRARQIGYSPVDSTLGVSRNATARLTIRMHRVPAMLSLVRINGHRKNECVVTGIPDSTADPTLAAIFTQIRENVDRYDLLLKQYPVRYTREEQAAIRLTHNRGDSVALVDTVAYESRGRRAYHVGGLLFRDSIVHHDSVFRDVAGAFCASRSQVPNPENGDYMLPVCSRDSRVPPVYVQMQTRVVARRRLMELPTFADLVDPTFLAAHCFEYGGTIGKEGRGQLIRVDFQPAKSIKSPDVSGSVYLAADSLVLRRAVFEMTKPQAATPPLLGFNVTTTFLEILPLVPVVDSVESVQPLLHGLTALGSDRVIGLYFEAATPGDQSTTLPVSTSVATQPDTAAAASAKTVAVDAGITRLRAAFSADRSCTAPPPADTISALLYATLHGLRPPALTDSAWLMYASKILNAFSQVFTLPEQLPVSTFSWPFEHAVRSDNPVRSRTVTDTNGAATRPTAVVPPIDASQPRSSTLAVLVLDDAGNPVPFAAVQLAGISTQERTDVSGAARIRPLRPGAYLLRVRRIGYAALDTTIRVRAGQPTTTDTIYTARTSARLAVITIQGRNTGPFVMPMMSAVVSLTLGADGSLKDAHVTASTASDSADALVLAAVRRAGDAHAFPPLGDGSDPAQMVSVELALSVAEPAPGEQAVALSRLDAPAWPSAGGAHLMREASSAPGFLSANLGAGAAADTAALEFVVSDRGEVIPGTARLDYSAPGPHSGVDREPAAHRLMSSLGELRFTPARVAGCQVPEFVRQAFGYNLKLR